MRLPVGLGPSLTGRGQKPLVIEVIAKAGLPAVTATHDVENRAARLNAQHAGHGPGLRKQPFSVNGKDCPSYASSV